jgi:hypothetical protein
MPARPEIAGRIDQAGTADRSVHPVDVTEDSADLAVPNTRKHHPVDPVVAAATVGCTVPGAIAHTTPPARKSKGKKRARAPPNPLVGEASKTIDEFCEHEKISRAKYYQLRKIGKGPVELRVGGVIRITPQAHAKWRRKYTKPSATAASGNQIDIEG